MMVCSSAWCDSTARRRARPTTRRSDFHASLAYFVSSPARFMIARSGVGDPISVNVIRPNAVCACCVSGGEGEDAEYRDHRILSSVSDAMRDSVLCCP